MLKWLTKHKLFDFNEDKQRVILEKAYKSIASLKKQSNQALLLNNYVRFYFLFIQFVARSGLNDIKIDSFDWIDKPGSLYNDIPEIFDSKKYDFDSAMEYFILNVLAKTNSVEDFVEKAEGKELDMPLSKLTKLQQKKDEL